MPLHGLWRGIEAAQLTDVVFEEPILDLGCGHGKFAAQYFDHKLKLGLDLSQKALKRAERSQAHQARVLANAARVPVRDDFFATVFSNSAVEHMPPLRDVLREVFRILRPGGTFVFTVPSHLLGKYLFCTSLFEKLGLDSLAEWYIETLNRQKDHLHCYDHKTWEGLLTAAGLEMAHYKYYLCPAVVRAWDLSQVADIGCRRVRVSNLAKRIGGLLERAKVNSLPRAATELSNRLFQGLYSAEEKCSANAGGGLMILARKPTVSLSDS